MFSKLLAALGLAPKTLDQARGTFTEAKTFAESVNALFTAAALTLETLLTAGPDSLKLHIAGLDNTAEVTRLTSELTTATAALDTAKADAKVRDEILGKVDGIFQSIGFKMDPNFKDDPKAKFAAHVEKQTTLKLANSGHPPKHVPAAVDTPPAANSEAADEALYVEYSAMATGPIRLDFFTKNEVALNRAKKARDAKA